MKLLLLGLLMSSTAVFAAGVEQIFMDNLKPVVLNKQESNQLTLAISYPGQLTGNCGMAIQAGGNGKQSLLKLMKLVEFTTLASEIPRLPQVGKNSLVFEFSNGLTRGAGAYLGGFTIKTKDGRSLADNTAALALAQDLKVVVVPCL